MPARAGALCDLPRYGLQRRLAKPELVFVGGDVNYDGKLPASVSAVKRRYRRQVSSQRAFPFL